MNIEKEAAKLIIGKKDESDRFWINFPWFKIPLHIPLQTASQVFKTSYFACKMTDINKDGEAYPEMVRNRRNINLQCKAIAVATGSWIPFLWLIIKKKSTNEDIHKLYKMIKVKSDPEAFFFTMALVKGMNKLITKKTKEE